MLSKPVIKQLRSLHLKKFREEEGVFLVEGPKMVNEVLVSRKWNVRAIYALSSWKKPAGTLPCPVTEISEKELEQISSLQQPNKVVAVVDIPSDSKTPVTLPETGLFLLLDQIQDPGNLGTIIRIADWFGMKDVFCSPDTADCFNPKVIQSTMGSLFRVSVHYLPLTDLLVKNAKGHQLPVYATMLNGKDIYTEPLKRDGLIILGNESRGVNPVLLPFVTNTILIPSKSTDYTGAESLNVAVAAGIVCAEFFRQMR
ncbi:MAG: RNA methyltransferase [Bacteroidia bacterium]